MDEPQGADGQVMATRAYVMVSNQSDAAAEVMAFIMRAVPGGDAEVASVIDVTSAPKTMSRESGVLTGQPCLLTEQDYYFLGDTYITDGAGREWVRNQGELRMKRPLSRRRNRELAGIAERVAREPDPT